MMAKFMLQIVLIIIVLMFGVFLGMDTAQKGIHSIEGSPKLPVQPLKIAKNTDDAVEVSVFGKPVSSSVKIVQTRSVFSNLGNTIGDSLEVMTRKGIEKLLGFF